MSLNILVINFFPAFYPPASGGETRLFRLYQELATENRITLLTSTDFDARAEQIAHTPRLRELRFPKDQLWRNAYAALERAGITGDLSGLAFALAVSEPRCALRQAALDLAPSADLVIHEFPYSEPVFREWSPRIEIYNSHNAEIALLPSVISGAGVGRAFSKLLRLERNLIERVRRVFTSCAEDGEIFRVVYGIDRRRLARCPNGYREAELGPIRLNRGERRSSHGSRPKLLFIGSQHPPNIEAAKYLLELAAAMPECDITIAGDVSARLPAQGTPANITLIGRFDASTKKRLLESADIFLNPIVAGSGTSLKAVEALAAGLPMVSTPEGARGLGIAPDRHALIGKRAKFPAAIRSLFADAPRLAALAEAGAGFARERLEWSAIAGRLCAELTAIAADKRTEPAASPPVALAFNDFPVTPTTSGGSARIRALLAGLGIDVVLIVFAERCQVELVEPGFVQLKIAKSESHRASAGRINDGQLVSANDIVASLYCADDRLIADTVAILAARCRLVIFEHCYMAPTLDMIDKIVTGLPIVYSAHNIEWKHKVLLLQQHPFCSSLTYYTREIEDKLINRADLVVACTKADAAYFAGFGKTTIVVPNAAAPPAPVARQGGMPAGDAESPTCRVGFLGSAHPPNLDAAGFILDRLAPQFPQVTFELVGPVCKPLLGRPLPPNLVLHGVVDVARKSDILSGWAVALNPVEGGGGSSLKLPDYLAHGLPVLSTAVGARGFPLAERRAGIVAERADFAARLRTVLADERLRGNLAQRARDFARGHLDWEAAVAPYRKAVEKWLEGPPPPPADRPALLVVTYRYTEPPLGGAESYLIEAVRRLGPRCRTIDLAAIDLGSLVNHFHFASEYESEAAGSSRVLADGFDTARIFAPDPPDADLIERCRRLERGWARAERELYRPFAEILAANGTPALFAGFYPHESHPEGPRRWTAPSFSILLPPGARIVRITGWTPLRKHLRFAGLPLSAAGPPAPAEHRQIVDGQFSCWVMLPPELAAGFGLLECRGDEHVANGDHRPLGICVHDVTVLAEPAAGAARREGQAAPLIETALDLARENDTVIKSEAFSDWIDRLIRQALARPAEDEAEFERVRGPHSRALQAWLARHAARYDAVLVQGIPFSVIPNTVETLAGLDPRPRIVTLPHLHADDRFYYWRQYLDAFGQADANLVFSETAARQLRAHGRFEVVPGGGIALDEQPHPADIAQFRSLVSFPGRFYLVLGRISLSKGCQRVVRAYSALREAGAPFDLVLIGPYEDGPRPEGAGVHYLGAQPRGIVLAALSQCIGLLTMSESESFGIVLGEAWKFKKPVVANAACQAFRELVRQDKNGLLVASEDELRQAMTTLAGDAELATRLGQAGFDVATSRFFWRHVADRLFEVLFPATSAMPDAVVGFNADLDEGAADAAS